MTIVDPNFDPEVARQKNELETPQAAQPTYIVYDASKYDLVPHRDNTLRYILIIIFAIVLGICWGYLSAHGM